MTNIPNEFFTVESIGTLTGATGLCFVITNGIRRAFGFDPRWLGLVVAQLVAILGAALVVGSPFKYVLAIANGFLIFSTATGAAAMTGRTTDKGEIGFAASSPSKPFFSRWF